MMDGEKAVIVIGGNHHNTLGVIRSLGRVGIKPYVIITSGKASSFVLKSKYIKKGWVAADSDAAIGLLKSQLASDEEKSVIIACHDVISSLLDLNRNDLWQHFILPGCKCQGRVTKMMNKKTMGDMAKHVGLNVPNSFVLNSSSLITEELSFPVITKPIESRAGSKSEIHVCENRDQLAAFLNKEGGKNFLVQKFVDKNFEFQLIGCSLHAGEEIIIPGVSRIIRQPQTTNTGFLHYRALDQTFVNTVEKTKAFIRETDYSGLFSVEFLRDKRGIDYFMEMNFRNDGNAIAVTNAGVNLPYIWYLSCVEKDYTTEIKPIHNENVMPEFAELSLYIHGAISRKQWKDDIKQSTSYMDYDPDDPSPTNGWSNYKRNRRFAEVKRLGLKMLGGK